MLQVDIFQADLILIPIHLGAHWAVVFVDPKKDLIEYYDSMLCDGQTSLSRIRFAMILKILPYNY